LNKDIPHSINNPIDEGRIQRLREAVGPGPALILTHDNPDPDALASGKALATCFLELCNIQSDLLYSGIIARAENQAMLKILVPEWQPAEQFIYLSNYSSISLVDTQPGAGNNSLPDDIVPHIVIDHHHPIRDGLDIVPYIDMRPDVGATVSLLFQHLEAAQISPDANLATAMFYGIQTDTQGLSRGTSPLDQYVYFNLLGLLDREKLIQVERAGLSRDYFRAFSMGLQSALLYQQTIVADLKQMHRPDFVAEIADLLIRYNKAQAALCVGYHDQTLFFSLRTKPSGIDAGLLVQHIIVQPGKAGGHGTMAGGQIDLSGIKYNRTAAQLIDNFLNTMKESGEGEPLLQ